jgi:predicted lipoprotein with Yx(FWY)xxD motif
MISTNFTPRRLGMAASLAFVAAFAAACSSSGSGTATGGGGPYGGNAGAPATQAVAGATEAPAGATQAPAAGSATVVTKTIGSQTILVAGSNGMTVYFFSKDTANSGKSVCSGQCLITWPALTVPAGSTPSGGDGVGGQLGTITRTDNGALQVTYNGLPLYFYEGDKAAGDTNGNYPNWVLVQP